MNLPILPNWFGYVMSLIALILCLLYLIEQFRKKTDKFVDKDKAKKDIEEWSTSLREVDIKLRDTYRKMIDVCEEVN
jgi:hypothetical protein